MPQTDTVTGVDLHTNLFGPLTEAQPAVPGVVLVCAGAAAATAHDECCLCVRGVVHEGVLSDRGAVVMFRLSAGTIGSAPAEADLAGRQAP